MAHTVVLTDVPASRVDDVVTDFESEGATVSKTLQPNGKFTVTATFPKDASIEKLSEKHGVVNYTLMSWKSGTHNT